MAPNDLKYILKSVMYRLPVLGPRNGSKYVMSWAGDKEKEEEEEEEEGEGGEGGEGGGRRRMRGEGDWR